MQNRLKTKWTVQGWMCMTMLFAFMVSCTSGEPSTPLSAQVDPNPANIVTPELTPTNISLPTLSDKRIIFLNAQIEAKEKVDGDAPYYAQNGAYLVRSREFYIMNGDASIHSFIFFPTRPDGTPDPSDAPYPLIVFSPGAGSPATWYSKYLAHLSSYGFVVITWTTKEMEDGVWRDYIIRPIEAKQLIDQAESMTSEGGELEGIINVQHIGIAGHSLGGTTALVVGGALMDMGWCLAHTDLVAELLDRSCPDMMNHQRELADLLGLETVPEGLWPSLASPRVNAVIAMAPQGGIWGVDYSGVASIKIPIMIMTGSEDTVLKPEYCAFPIYDKVVSAKKSLMTFQGKSHNFFNSASKQDRYLVDHFTTAFWLTELKGDAEAAKALMPENVGLPSVAIQTTEFSVEQ